MELLTETLFWKSSELRENGLSPLKHFHIRKKYLQVNVLLVVLSVTYMSLSAMGNMLRGVCSIECAWRDLPGEGPS